MLPNLILDTLVIVTPYTPIKIYQYHERHLTNNSNIVLKHVTDIFWIEQINYGLLFTLSCSNCSDCIIFMVDFQNSDCLRIDFEFSVTVYKKGANVRWS